MLLTILTPTYNRENLLPKLYDSLCGQSDKNFMWLVIDDGSVDETENLIMGYAKKGKIDISYFRRQNGGKHRAINFGMQNVNTPLVMFVDSDDYLTEDAVETISFYHEKYKKTSGLCGYCFYRQLPNGKIMGFEFPEKEKTASLIDYRINLNGALDDKAEVFFADKVLEFPFPEFDGEKFVAEDIAWIPMALQYDMVHIAKKIYIAEYLPQGLTANARVIRIKSPRAEIARGFILMNKKLCLKIRIKGALMVNVYALIARVRVKKSLFCKLFFVPSWFIYNNWKRRYKI